MKRTVSENSLSSSKEGKPELKFGGKSRGKLWPFIKKNKVLAVRTLSGLRQPGAEAWSLSFGLNQAKLSPSRKRERAVSVLRSFHDANDLFLVVVSLPWLCPISDALSPGRVSHTNTTDLIALHPPLLLPDVGHLCREQGGAPSNQACQPGLGFESMLTSVSMNIFPFSFRSVVCRCMTALTR